MLRQNGIDAEMMIFDNKDIAGRNLIAVGLESIWSQQAFRRVQKRLSETEYDLVHVQNFFPLISPSVYYAAKSAKKPVVQALRNYRLVCPNVLLFREGHPCEDCLRWVVPWPGVVHRCYQAGLWSCGAVGMMLVVHRMLGTWRKKVDGFYTLSEFAKSKLVKAGISGERISIKPNLAQPDPGPSEGSREFAFFAGRLVAEKGVNTLLDAWTLCADQIPLLIAGEGPLAARVEEAARRFPWITNLGRIPNGKVLERIGGARFVVLPSELYEVFSRIIVEGFAKGTPVIAANIGSTRELVKDHSTGLLFAPGDSADLARKVQWAWDHPREMAEMGRRARRDYEEKYSPHINYKKMMDICNQAMENNRRQSPIGPHP